MNIIGISRNEAIKNWKSGMVLLFFVVAWAIINGIIVFLVTSPFDIKIYKSEYWTVYTILFFIIVPIMIGRIYPKLTIPNN